MQSANNNATMAKEPVEQSAPSQPEGQGRESVQDKLDKLSNALVQMQSMMVKRGMFDPPAGNSNNESNKFGDRNSKPSGSETTIYCNAVEFRDPNIEQNDITEEREVPVVKEKRDSTSSEDQVDTSDELIEFDEHDKFISECRREVTLQHNGPSTSGYQQPRQPREESRGDQIVKEAESAKARVLATPGMIESSELIPGVIHSSVLDEDYMVVGSNIDMNVQKRIIENEYIDFARLLPKDRVLQEEDHRMEIVSKGGHTYFVPAADREYNGGVTNFNKWEQAFRVFSNIYMRQYPHKAAELIQYNHIIHMASLNYTWDNVYLYDKEFCLHISRHPTRSWAIILQQAWAIRLKDRLRTDNYPGGGDVRRPRSKEPCRRFNRGNCSYGQNCRFDHHCSVRACGKFGHGAHICRKRQSQPECNDKPVTNAGGSDFSSSDRNGAPKTTN